MKKGILTVFASLFLFLQGYAKVKNESYVLKTASKNIYGICFTKGGSRLIVADNKTIKVYSIKTKKLLKVFDSGYSGQILSVDISRDSTLLVSGGKDGTIVIRNFINGKILKKLTYQKGIVTSVSISPDGRYLASGGTDHRVFIYDLKENKVVNILKDHAKDITSVKYSPNGKLLATASGDKTITLYNRNGKLIATLRNSKSWVRGIAFNKNGTKLISCGDYSRINQWNIQNLKNIEFMPFKYYGLSRATSIDFCEDNKTYVFGSLSGTVEIIGHYGIYKKNIGAPVTKVLFIPNTGAMLKLVVATMSKGVILLSAENMKMR